MVKVIAPGMSLDASGTLGNALVFSKWKGRNYIRERVIPANPKSGGQVGVRSMFKFLSQFWASLTAGNQATWEDRAADLVASEFNAYLSYNMRRWRNFEAPSQEDPAAEVSTTPDLMTGVATPGIRSMSLAITHGTNLADWGCMIFRDLTTAFDLTWDRCIAIVEVDGSGDAEYIDTPLEPDQYFYNTKGFNDDGILGADGTEFNGTIT